ncbi:hypothetical protein H5410_027002 [Solanum commersonii]|uniref:Uncharacterized protein n=1 Tax=Solanum commersonii TaxID=4109 RepID=A0A9J5Z355_SOLCO|nr:hypothetical protein H5410_027002 [Solanum commersonii]
MNDNLGIMGLLRVKRRRRKKFMYRKIKRKLTTMVALKKQSWYCGSSSSSFDGGDKETIFAMESKIAYLNAELVVVAEREKKREEKERKREKEIAVAKKVENKRYAALQAQLTFLFESGNILPPCPASSDENDKSDKESEGDENGTSDKESEHD